MLITKKYIDETCPTHCRTSCSDDNLSNGFGGWYGLYDRKTGKKEIRYPRCNRCYLLNNLGIDTEDLDFSIHIEVHLKYKEE